MLTLALVVAGCTTTTPSEPTPSPAATTDANDYGATLAPSIDSPSWEPADAERAGTEAAGALTAFTPPGGPPPPPRGPHQTPLLRSPRPPAGDAAPTLGGGTTSHT